MDPFLRTATRMAARAKPTPDGWQVEQAGRWRGRQVEVVFDPRRHDVALLRGAQPPRVAAALRAEGWRCRGIDGDNQWWSRDRVAVARRRIHGHTGRGSDRAIA